MSAVATCLLSLLASSPGNVQAGRTTRLPFASPRPPPPLLLLLLLLPLLLLLLVLLPPPLQLLLLFNDAAVGPCIKILAHLGRCPDLILQQKGKHKHSWMDWLDALSVSTHIHTQHQ
jgi:hypothetical protein